MTNIEVPTSQRVEYIAGESFQDFRYEQSPRRKIEILLVKTECDHVTQTSEEYPHHLHAVTGTVRTKSWS